MPVSDKALADDMVASIRWPRSDYDRIELAVTVIRERDHLDLSRAEFIRLATRRLMAHVMAGGSLAEGMVASEPAHPQRRASDAA